MAGIAFASPAFARQRIRITGVCTAQHSGKGVSQLRADLVVDAIGRGARTPVMLERLGYGRPAVDKVTVHLKYSTQLLRLPPDALREMGFIVSPIPGRPRRLALALCEHGTYMLTVFGMAGDDPPDTFTEMLEFARAFAPPHAMAALESATPMAPPAQHRNVQPLVPIRPGAATAGRITSGWRRCLQLQPDLRAGNDGGCAGGVGTAGLLVERDSRSAALILPRQCQAHPPDLGTSSRRRSGAARDRGCTTAADEVDEHLR